MSIAVVSAIEGAAAERGLNLVAVAHNRGLEPVEWQNVAAAE